MKAPRGCDCGAPGVGSGVAGAGGVVLIYGQAGAGGVVLFYGQAGARRGVGVGRLAEGTVVFVAAPQGQFELGAVAGLAFFEQVVLGAAQAVGLIGKAFLFFAELCLQELNGLLEGVKFGALGGGYGYACVGFAVEQPFDKFKAAEATYDCDEGLPPCCC